MADTPTPEALRALAFLATTPAFAIGQFDERAFDTQSHTTMADPTSGVPYSVIATGYVKDPEDPFEIARAAGGQGSIRGTTGLYSTVGLSNDEITPYPFGSHEPNL
jgi:hypothetical protein